MFDLLAMKEGKVKRLGVHVRSQSVLNRKRPTSISDSETRASKPKSAHPHTSTTQEFETRFVLYLNVL